MDLVDALNRGIELFDQQKYSEAYEVWHARWQEEATDAADLLQGLLQVAVGMAKLCDGNARGTVKLLDSGAQRLQNFRPEAYDIDIEGLLILIGEWRAQAVRLLESPNFD